MDYVKPRTVGEESTTQDNVVKAPAYMPKVENAEGNEAASVTAGLGATATQSGTPFAAPSYLNIDASTENRSAKFKNGEGGPATGGIPEAGRNQYQ